MSDRTERKGNCEKQRKSQDGERQICQPPVLRCTSGFCWNLTGPWFSPLQSEGQPQNIPGTTLRDPNRRSQTEPHRGYGGATYLSEEWKLHRSGTSLWRWKAFIEKRQRTLQHSSHFKFSASKAPGSHYTPHNSSPE